MSHIDRRFRLVEGAGSLGLDCGLAGASLAGAPLLSKTASGFKPRAAREIDALLKAAYGEGVDAAGVSRGLDIIADALNRDDLGRAQVAALRLRLADLDWDAAARIAYADRSLVKYDPDEPRDWHGRWTTGDDGGRPPDLASSAGDDVSNAPVEEVNPETITPVAYNGHFHDQVAADYAAYLRSKGEIVETEVNLQMANGIGAARIDILAWDPVTRFLYGVEVKTGRRPSFTTGQLIVYPHLMWGGSVIAQDGKVLSLGIMPNTLLQPIPIFMVDQRDAASELKKGWLDPEALTRYYRLKVLKLLGIDVNSRV